MANGTMTGSPAGPTRGPPAPIRTESVIEASIEHFDPGNKRIRGRYNKNQAKCGHANGAVEKDKGW